jgi:hypothetical protein
MALSLLHVWCLLPGARGEARVRDGVARAGDARGPRSIRNRPI